MKRNLLLPQGIQRSAAEQQAKSWQEFQVLLRGTKAEQRHVLLEPGSQLLTQKYCLLDSLHEEVQL